MMLFFSQFDKLREKSKLHLYSAIETHIRQLRNSHLIEMLFLNNLINPPKEVSKFLYGVQEFTTNIGYKHWFVAKPMFQS